MSLSEKLTRLKGRFKNKLHPDWRNSSTSSLPTVILSSPSPVPRVVSDTATSEPNAPAPVNAPVLTLTSSHLAPPSHKPAASTISLPNIINQDDSSTRVPAGHTTRNADCLGGSPTTEQRSKKPIWTGLKALLQVVDSSVDAFGPLKSAVRGLNQCIDIFEKAAKGREEYNELQQKLDSLLGDLSQFLGGQESPSMTASIRNLCNGIESEIRLVQEKQDRGRVRQLAEVMEDTGEILECYRRIHGHLERLTMNADLSIWKIVDGQATESRLTKLSPTLSAIYNSAEARNVKRGPCTTGTREREILKLLRWARGCIGSYIYWMNGMAGTGKTTITYSLCAELDATAELAASFFCSRLIPECRNVNLILPTIAYQLARFSHPFLVALSRILESEPDVHTRDLRRQFDNLIVKPLLKAKQTLPSHLVVVIDALDECDNEDGVGQILEVLLEHPLTSQLPIRFLVSSRPEPEIYRRMMKQLGGSLGARLVLHELNPDDVQHDIETYLKDELKEVPLLPVQLTDLVKRSGVLFIFAATAARYIRDGLVFQEHEERLERILGLATKTSGGRDRDIDKLYSSILKAAFQTPNLDESTQRRMKTILDTVICAQEPMTVGTLAGLLKLKSGKQVDGLLRPLCSVVSIAETSGLVTTLHASFPDFMLDQDRSMIFYCDPAKNHGRMAHACFELIRLNDPQFNICGFESSYLPDDQVPDLHKRVDQAVSPELSYACRYWIGHIEHIAHQKDTEELLFDFLSARLLLWMEVLNVKKSMQLGPKMIRRVEIWSRSHGCSQETLKLAHDAWRFVTMFASHAVSQSTPHLYTSMLPFWSESAPIAQNYMPRAHKMIKPEGTAMKRRQVAPLATIPMDNRVLSACFSRDGSRIVLAAGKNVYILDGYTGQTIMGPLEGHISRVNSVAFSSTSKLIVSGSGDSEGREHSIRVWDAQTGKMVIGPLEGHTKKVNSVAFSPDSTRIVSGSDDLTIRLWQTKTDKKTIASAVLSGHQSRVSSVAFSPDGRYIVSGSHDYTIRLWDVHSREMLFGPLVGHISMVFSVAFSSDGTRLVSGAGTPSISGRGEIRIWDTQTGKQIIGPLKGKYWPIFSVAFSPDDTRIVSGSADGTVQIWDLQSGITIGHLEGHTKLITSVAFSPDNNRIVSTSHDNTLRLWDVQVNNTMATPFEGPGEVYSVAFSPDGTRIVSGGRGNDRAFYHLVGVGAIGIWDAQNGQAINPLKDSELTTMSSVAFSPDGTRIVAGCYDHTVKVVDAQSGEMALRPLKGHTAAVHSVAFSPDGTLIASGSVDHTIRLWKARTGEAITTLDGHLFQVKSVAFSPDSAFIVSSSKVDIRLWDVQSRSTIISLPQNDTFVDSVMFSPDGTRIVSGASLGLKSDGPYIKVWDARSGKPSDSLFTGHTCHVTSVAFSPDGTHIVSGSFDFTVRVWDVQTGETVIGPLRGYTDMVHSVVFSPDGTLIASGASDRTIRVWDVSGALISELHSHIYSLQVPVDISKSQYPSVRLDNPWVLDRNGWMVDSECRLLAWVPHDLHRVLLRYRNTMIISVQGSLRVNFTNAAIGDSWASCYQPAPSSPLNKPR